MASKSTPHCYQSDMRVTFPAPTSTSPRRRAHCAACGRNVSIVYLGNGVYRFKEHRTRALSSTRA